MVRRFGWAGSSDVGYNPMAEPTTDAFGALRVVARTPILDLKSTFPVSQVRDNVTATSGGAVVNTADGELALSVMAIAGSSVILQSSQRSAYQSGYGAECGIGIRLPANFAAGHVARWGFYDANNGFFWQYDTVNKLSAVVRRGGVDTAVSQANFTTDKLDGTGPSEHLLDMTRGIIWRVLFTWYGYGTINFVLSVSNAQARQCIIPCHQAAVPWSTSVTSPHLPIRAELINVSGTVAQSMFVAGRQFSIIGPFNPASRMSPLFSSGKTYSNVATPVYAVRRKASHLGINLNLKGFDLQITSTAFLQISIAATVVGGTWGAPANVQASETALEVNSTFISATAGILSYGSLLKLETNVDITQAISLSETDIMLFTLTALSGNGNQTLTGLLVKMEEQW